MISREAWALELHFSLFSAAFVSEAVRLAVAFCSRELGRYGPADELSAS